MHHPTDRIAHTTAFVTPVLSSNVVVVVIFDVGPVCLFVCLYLLSFLYPLNVPGNTLHPYVDGPSQ